MVGPLLILSEDFRGTLGKKGDHKTYSAAAEKARQ